jgi:RHS repeat-associated protein
LDAAGNRTAKTDDLAGVTSNYTTTTNCLYDGGNMVETVDEYGNIIARLAQGQGFDDLLAESTAGATSFYEQDGLGSVTSLTNSSGALAQTYTFDSFGNTTNSSGSISNPFRYTGRDFDSETGLYYYRARYYDPATGRFLSEDPFRFRGGSNFYRYALGSPIDYIDPLGLKPGTKWYQWSGWNWVPGVGLVRCSIWSHYCIKEMTERRKELDPFEYQFSNEDLSNFEGDEGKRLLRLCTQGDENCKLLNDECGGPILGLIFKTGAFPTR